ncbi:bis-aminopropyl spermidine synthase family protein [Paenibacillus sp. J5C_2022]|uniref:bis-aminopropyl spermidine synthase family protein n=1 Tax=Paenibacillus sp. J5C2022 TaxID=2977129 RepID=UPI0021D3CA38|nr:bis-aminopropyl spermidine synthase family protein [Paenibacillus sp. J5C2022]MCU6707267.1 bis-aminopropyl spermidine synthase family protein [Paenibacillus sp. J5C2022]
MSSYITVASRHMNLQEGTGAIEQLLIECYLSPGISTKELARKLLLPIPVTAAIKRELMKAGALVQDRGVKCTIECISWIEREWGFDGLDIEVHAALLSERRAEAIIRELADELDILFHNRPQVDVTIDQSQCTPETSLRRAILCLRQHALIGKRILCVGDDDLVSVSIGLLLQRLFPNRKHTATKVDVVDIDERFLHFIANLAEKSEFPIACHRKDLRHPLPHALMGQFDCIFTDPPYTLQGMSLFLSRGITALKCERGLPIFLSFAHKAPPFMLAVQREFLRMGLTVHANFPRFNAYEGAEMIANRSQLFILRTTDQTVPEYREAFQDALYTGEVRQTLRTYQCKHCSQQVKVGLREEIETIEQLKNEGCPTCSCDTFVLVKREQLSAK